MTQLAMQGSQLAQWTLQSPECCLPDKEAEDAQEDLKGKAHPKEGAGYKGDCPAIVLVDTWPYILESGHCVQRRILSPDNWRV